jgi:hypothetical protein
MNENIDAAKALQKPVLALILVISGVLFFFLFFFFAPLIDPLSPAIYAPNLGAFVWRVFNAIFLNPTSLCLLVTLVLTLVALIKRKVSFGLMTAILVISCLGVGPGLVSLPIDTLIMIQKNSRGTTNTVFRLAYFLTLPGVFLIIFGSVLGLIRVKKGITLPREINKNQ